MVDVATPAPVRLAALTVLGVGTQWGLRSPTTFSGVLDRGPDDGLVTGNVTLSPSQAQLYEDCPRRYALERRLKVGSDISLHASFGTLIHDVLEEVEQRAIDSGRSRASLDQALAELDRQFDPMEFDGQPFADSWLKRGRDGLTRLYERWPAPKRRAAVLEHTLDTEIAGVTWTGRADRIDVANDGMTIVDYKTSKSVPSTADAAQSLQLGFYALAASRDPHLAELGAVVGAELWYPMKDAKSVTTRRFDMEALNDVAGRLEEAALGIKAEDWSPRPGTQCARCALREICPAWTEGGPEFA